MKSRRTTLASISLALILVLAACGGGGSDSADGSEVIVQGTTSVRDSGLLDNVLKPGFEEANPEYTLKFIAVGSGEALANAEAGQGDAVFVHDPEAEAEFVATGYAYEDRGYPVMRSDFITVGPASDPAGVGEGAPNEAVAALEGLAEAGAAGEADFVSRGDDSGTNKKELAIWELSDVSLNDLGEPGAPGTETNPGWYHKAGQGMSQTLTVTQQCPFDSGACYTLADRGTYEYLLDNGAIDGLEIISEGNEEGARGGEDLLLNPYSVYAVNPDEVPEVNLEGGLAFVEYVTSPAFQDAVASYPTAERPAFIPDA